MKKRNPEKIDRYINAFVEEDTDIKVVRKVLDIVNELIPKPSFSSIIKIIKDCFHNQKLDWSPKI